MKKVRKIFDEIKNDYRHYICITMIVAMLLILFLKFNHSFGRFFECFRNFWTSGKYYVSELFGLKLHDRITVNEFTSMPFSLPFNLPETWEEFSSRFSGFWGTFFSEEIFLAYLDKVSLILFVVSKVLVIALPVIVIIILSVSLNSNSDKEKKQSESKHLKRFKNFETKVVMPVKNWIKDFINFVNDNSIYKKLAIAILLFQFNIISIGADFISYYFYFAASFDLISLYTQFLRLMMDLSVLLNFIPKFCWPFIIYGLICLIRSKIGINNLNHMEMMDRGFINERPIVLMLCGTMGSKKTTVITDIALSQEIMLRNKAFEKIQEQDLKFPNFPWLNFETKIKQAIEEHKIYNLATAKKWVEEQKSYFDSIPSPGFIYGYDINKYKTEYDNNLYIENIWTTLTTYCQLYFIYLIQSSLIISNYSIRTDNELMDKGNFPLWNNDLFNKKSKNIEEDSQHSHILDFDSLRLGKKVLENNQLSDSFEFGVINITEIGKERGNSLENITIKKNDLTANQKNDLFNSWLKMVRHSATVDNFPFVKVIVDEQRPESWGADARDLCEIVYIDECSEMQLAMPMFSLEYLIISFFVNKFADRYYEFRFERSDMTLTMYLYHRFIAMLHNFRARIYNKYGYYNVKMKIEKGTMDEEPKKAKYYLMFKKIYSKRFSTDCFSDFFTEKALRSEFGLDDLPSFEKEKASFEEMLKENSYFFNDLVRIKNYGEEKKEEKQNE